MISSILAVVKLLHKPPIIDRMEIIEEFSRFYTDLASMQVSALKNIYHENVVFIDPIAEHNGLSAVEHYFAKLLNNAKYCEFDIHTTDAIGSNGYCLTWTMRFTSSRINKGQAVSVNGITIIRIEDGKIRHHRDYYDLGQMVYEHIPLLGRIIKSIKRKLA